MLKFRFNVLLCISDSSGPLVTNFCVEPIERPVENRVEDTLGLGGGGDVREWHFEYVPDVEEGTNVDVAWQDSGGTWIFCEVKLSESEFGSAKPDQRHEKKLQRIYSPRLHGLVDERLLGFDEFCRHYQLLRNISLLATHSGSHVIFLIPEQNDALSPTVNAVLGSLAEPVRRRVHVAHLEKVLTSIKNDSTLNPELKVYAA